MPFLFRQMTTGSRHRCGGWTTHFRRNEGDPLIHGWPQYARTSMGELPIRDVTPILACPEALDGLSPVVPIVSSSRLLYVRVSQRTPSPAPPIDPGPPSPPVSVPRSAPIAMKAIPPTCSVGIMGAPKLQKRRTLPLDSMASR